MPASLLCTQDPWQTDFISKLSVRHSLQMLISTLYIQVSVLDTWHARVCATGQWVSCSITLAEQQQVSLASGS